jgi:arylsulfatase A-like enzyme
MLGSQGEEKKQRPWDESIRVPFLLKYPDKFGRKGKTVDTLLSTPDIMPTLLSMSDIPVPSTVEGKDLYPILIGKKKDDTDAALIECISPFGEWERGNGGKEYRGIRTRRYTFVRDLSGAWLLFDNEADPFQQVNLVGNADYAAVQTELDTLLKDKLTGLDDEFLPGDAYIEKWGYKVNERGTVEYVN